MDYLEFRQQYEQQHPASIPQQEAVIADFPAWLQPLCLIMFVAVSIVSGVHTISTIRQTFINSLFPEQYKDTAAFAAFFGFEVALFVSVYSWLRPHARWLSYTATGTVFFVIVLANIKDVANSLQGGNFFDAIIILGIGIGTPLVALLSGKLLVDVFRSGRVSELKARETYRASLSAWDAQIQRAWTTYQKRTDRELSGRTDNADKWLLSGQADGQRTNYGRTADARTKVLQYLEENPDAYKLTVRELAIAAGVGKTVAAEVKAAMNGADNHNLL